MAEGDSSRKIGSRAGVRHSYESVLSASARLHSYATGQAAENDGLISKRQDVLAYEDLAAFAIHSRRLIESTISTRTAANTTVKAMYDGQGGDIPITRILNTMIHHRSMEIYRNDFYFQLGERAAATGEIRPLDAFYIKPKPIPPVCLVLSDKGKAAVFRIIDLLNVFEGVILSLVVDYCDERQLYLDDPLGD